MFLNLTLASGHTSPIIASGILNPALAYLPCSRPLHVKYRLLPEDLITPPDIGARHKILPDRLTFWRYSRNRNRLPYEQSLINAALYSHGECCIVNLTNVQKAPC